jgi:copper chaperone
MRAAGPIEVPRMTIRLNVTGMTCSGCAAAVERIIKTADPTAGVAVDVASGRVEVDTRASAAALVQAIEAGGYGAKGA